MSVKGVLIGICGRTASGKSSIAKEISNRAAANDIRVGILQMDDFYRDLSMEEHALAMKNEYNFDQLSAFDLQSFRKQLSQAQMGDSIEYYHYDHAEHRHTTELLTQAPAKFWIIEGLYLFADEEIAKMFDLKIFMDVDSDTSLARRVRRDCVYRGRTVESVLDQYEQYVKPAFQKLVEPYRCRSDITILRGARNSPALDTVVNFIRSKSVIF